MSVSTPCINICKIDEATGLCLGCWRSRAEIVAWGRMAESERLAIMADLPARSGQEQAVKVAQANHEQE